MRPSRELAGLAVWSPSLRLCCGAVLLLLLLCCVVAGCTPWHGAMDDTPTRGAKRTRRKGPSCSPCMPAAWSLPSSVVRSNDKKSGVLVCAMGYRTVGTCSNGHEERKDAGVASGWPRTPWGAGGGPRRQAGSVAALSVYRKPSRWPPPPGRTMGRFNSGRRVCIPFAWYYYYCRRRPLQAQPAFAAEHSRGNSGSSPKSCDSPPLPRHATTPSACSCRIINACIGFFFVQRSV